MLLVYAPEMEVTTKFLDSFSDLDVCFFLLLVQDATGAARITDV